MTLYDIERNHPVITLKICMIPQIQVNIGDCDYSDTLVTSTVPSATICSFISGTELSTYCIESVTRESFSILCNVTTFWDFNFNILSSVY